jgi:hypothetical protein
MDAISTDQGETYPFPNARFTLLYLLLQSSAYGIGLIFSV